MWLRIWKLSNTTKRLFQLRKLAIFKGIYIVITLARLATVRSLHCLHINLDVNVLPLTEHLSTVQFTTTLHLSLMTHFNLQHLHLHISWISDSDGMFGTFHLVGWIANCHIRKSFCCQKPSAERHEQSRQCPCVCQAWAFIAHPVR